MPVRGSGRVDVYRSKPSGDVVHLEGHAPCDADGRGTTLEFAVDLAPFEDGGWIWFDVFTDDAALDDRRRRVDCADEPLPPQKVAVGITTFNRLDDCVAALRALGEDPAVLDVVQQGLRRRPGRREDPRPPSGSPRRPRLLGDRLEVIEQDNLGGSGGFTRGLYEAIEHSRRRPDHADGRRHPAGAGRGPAVQRVRPRGRASRSSSAATC